MRLAVPPANLDFTSRDRLGRAPEDKLIRLAGADDDGRANNAALAHRCSVDGQTGKGRKLIAETEEVGVVLLRNHRTDHLMVKDSLVGAGRRDHVSSVNLRN